MVLDLVTLVTSGCSYLKSEIHKLVIGTTNRHQQKCKTSISRNKKGSGEILEVDGHELRKTSGIKNC